MLTSHAQDPGIHPQQNHTNTHTKKEEIATKDPGPSVQLHRGTKLEKTQVPISGQDNQNAVRPYNEVHSSSENEPSSASDTPVSLAD